MFLHLSTTVHHCKLDKYASDRDILLLLVHKVLNHNMSGIDNLGSDLGRCLLLPD